MNADSEQSSVIEGHKLLLTIMPIFDRFELACYFERACIETLIDRMTFEILSDAHTAAHRILKECKYLSSLKDACILVSCLFENFRSEEAGKPSFHEKMYVHDALTIAMTAASGKARIPTEVSSRHESILAKSSN